MFVGRQPIVNNRREIVAYQLLFRSDLATDVANVHDDMAATGDVLLNTLNNIGLERVLGNAVAFVKVPVDMLEHTLLEILPQRKIVLELPPDIRIDEPLLNRMVELKRMGYRFAMAHFRFDRNKKAFLDLLDFAKLSVGELSEAELKQEVKALRGYGLRLIAEMVESEEAFGRARSLFMNYYQGYFFARPETLHMRRVDPQAQRVARLFNLVLSDAPRDVIEMEFKQDVALSFNILRYINSPGMGVPEEVQTLQHALVMLGRNRLARWLSMMMIRDNKQSMAPKALLRTALIRARATELMGAPQVGAAYRDHLFMTGMFSMLDVLFGMSLEEAVGTLNLPGPIRQALVEKSGPYYPYLELARACDHFDVEAIRAGSRRLGIPLRQINRMQSEAMSWAWRMDEDIKADE
ncbi:EAL and modified HD-GYP domain-containing signal transduction protein [Natronospira proteinivora]|uniref:EAL and modified HD-GYP domain-containing signal transduction protein n=1 Tax=Natronospira proteinivora TaxID=1807133 RepID=A0ABT1G9A1_9GAMM|nr:EAL domain-containing protein [Natronospira proteinivora]MCP1726532.1 EAL and modified HD-GYP domain-containing signal transduction protein [Natronospira proteinivora]